MTFKEVFINHQGKLADKWETYLDAYSTAFVPYEDKPVRILEVGVMNGGTLEVLAEYFKNAVEIVGVDIDPACANLNFTDPRITLIIGDILNVELDGMFDIIIDDGSHICRDVIITFANYFQRLTANGLYAIEDLHASYWRGWGGGLYTPVSSMAFLKRLTDLVNWEHWRITSNPLDNIARVYETKFHEANYIKSIEFQNSLCLIHKSPYNVNRLGRRIISGSVETVTTGWLQNNIDTTIAGISAMAVNDENYDQFNLIEQIRQLDI